MTFRAAIVGCAGPSLLPEERDMFSRLRPFGLILFRRNCVTPDQIRALADDFRGLVGNDAAPVLIDQEGGRVARLSPPLWPLFPPAGHFGDMFRNSPGAAARAAFSHGRLLGQTLQSLGISVNCAPVCDLRLDGAHHVIGDRALSSDPHHIAMLAEAMAKGMMAEGVLPVMKHIPGHGRALADSHEDLPVVRSSLEVLEQTDFVPFRALAKTVPLGMTAHIIYEALDPVRPATVSGMVIGNTIRRDLGFHGLLMTDDMSMKALDRALPGTSMGQKAQMALEAGIDVILHCNGRADETASLLKAFPPLSAQAMHRWAMARAKLQRPLAVRETPM
ncbi:MAG: beta-N-acetylhexosaminidase [Pseudomonadota bacterium]|nr:beta-N-acetylhexosaminidase [Pseudomonadota bacterium]